MITPARILSLLATWALLPSMAGALSVRVDPAGGAPRIVVDGQPVRARIFFGQPGSQPIVLTPAWQQVQFEFTASGSADNGTMHFRFGQTPGDVYLDDIHVTDLDTGRDLIPTCDFEAGPDSFSRNWTFWPSGAKNTVAKMEVLAKAGHAGSAGLHIRLTAPADGKWPDFHVYHLPRLSIIQGHRYRVSFQARSDPGRKLVVAFYRPGQRFVQLGGLPDPFGPQIKLAADAGVNMVSFPVDLPWPEPGRAVDFSTAEAQCQTVLRANPDALLLPRIWMGTPAWWRKAHPAECMQWEDGRRGDAAVTSRVYRHDAAERLSALITHLEAKFPDHMAGYHPVGQNTGEWFYVDTWLQPLNGYSPATLQAWRQWLKDQYGNDPALRRTWHDATVTCESAAVPSAAARHAAPAGIFRDPATEQSLIDFARFQQQAMADCVCEFAHAARTASRGQKLVLFFYGYVFEFGAIRNGPAIAGHYALRRVLDCPDIDMLCSPISYFDRGLAQSAPSMTAAESVALAGKMWLNEDDTHTYIATGDFPGVREHVSTLEQTNDELTRNVAQESLRNFATWWMDLGASGWFNDPGMWAQMKRLEPLDRAMLDHPTPFRPEVAAVIDERGIPRIAAGATAVTVPGIYECRAALARMGAPYGQYLLDDVLAERVHAKVYVFLNAWSLSGAERENLRQVTRGATCIWCYAPGWYDGNRTSVDAMKELTGFELAVGQPQKAFAAPTAAGRQQGLGQPFGAQQVVRPLFKVIDARGDETLATWPDGTVAIAGRVSPQGSSIFCGAPGLTAELLRLAARTAGVHLFTGQECIVYANGPFIALHATHDGPVTVNTGKSGRIRDELSGADLGEGPVLTLIMKRGQTRILRY